MSVWCFVIGSGILLSYPCTCYSVPRVFSCLGDDIHLPRFYPAHKARGGNEVNQQRCRCKAFQITAATTKSSFLFDVTGRPGVVRHACPCLCQIKGQRLDSEATFLFILKQPRERPNKSGGNVVAGESERSLPTGRGKWRDSHSLNLLGCVLLLFLNVTFMLRSAGQLAWDHL